MLGAASLEVSTLEQTLKIRNGEEFVSRWRADRQEDLRILAQSGVFVDRLLGHGGRGEVFAGQYRGQQVAVKLFAYPEERSGQAAALRLWRGFAPRVISSFGKTALLLERIYPARAIAGSRNDLREGLSLARLIEGASPDQRPRAAETLSSHFEERLHRARQRNVDHGLFSAQESAEVEQVLRRAEAEKEIVVHGDFGGNLLYGPEPMVIDPRGFLWGDCHADLAKWLLYRRSGKDVFRSAEELVSLGYSNEHLVNWLLIQAYDEASALALLSPGDPRVLSYSAIARALLAERLR